jgi:hypothetical protein
MMSNPMTVSELIAKLQQLPQDLPVFYADADYGDVGLGVVLHSTDVYSSYPKYEGPGVVLK